MDNFTHTEALFSYGTLQYDTVQISTFGRRLEGQKAILKGFSLSMLEIKDAAVIATSGDNAHPILKYTGDQADQIAGTVFYISHDELIKADTYEVADYKRVKVKLDSGVDAWVYVSVDSIVAT